MAATRCSKAMRGARSAWSRCSRTCYRNESIASPRKVKPVRPSLPDSYERASHDSEVPSFLLDLRGGEVPGDVRDALMEPRLERFIGVIYRPQTERWSHYSEAILPRQFDAWVWF